MSGKRKPIQIPDSMDPSSRVWRSARFELDESARTLLVDGRAVDIAARPFDALLLLIKRAGQVVDKNEMLRIVWRGRVLSDTVLAKCISTLRQALGDEGHGMIATVHGIGYRLVVPVVAPGATATRTDPEARAATRAAALGTLVSLILGQPASVGVWGFVPVGRVTPEQAARVTASIQTRLDSLLDEEVFLCARANNDATALTAITRHAACIVDSHGGDTELVAALGANLAANLEDRGLWRVAESVLHATLRRAQAAGSAKAMLLRVQTAALASETGRHDDAEAHYRAVLVEAEARIGGRSVPMLDARRGLAWTAILRGHTDEAVRPLQALLRDVLQWYPQDVDRANAARWALATALVGRGSDLDSAQELLDEVLQGWGAEPGAPSVALGEAQVTLAELLLRLDNHVKAASLLDSVIARTGTRSLAERRLRVRALAVTARLTTGDGERVRRALADAHTEALRLCGNEHVLTRSLAQALAKHQPA